MSIPVEIVGEGIDWPAWVQAIGSVIAIGAAIWIDRGSARRARDADDRRIASAKIDWEAALGSARAITRNVSISLGTASRTEMDEAEVARYIGNAVSILEAYLRTPPPDPDLALTLAAAREQLREPAAAISELRSLSERQRERSYSTHLAATDRVRLALANASEGLDKLVEEFRNEKVQASFEFEKPDKKSAKFFGISLSTPKR